jgi:hypothetical protein
MEDKHKNLRLVKQEETLIPLMKNEDLKKDICIAISSGICTVPEDLVNLFNITYEQSITLLSDPGFLSSIKKYTTAKFQLMFHTSVPKELENIIKNGDNKEKLQAIKMYAQLTDNLKNTGTDNIINISLEGLVKQAEKTVNNPILDTDFRKVS